MKWLNKIIYSLITLPFFLSLFPTPLAHAETIDLTLEESIEARDPSIGQNSYNLSGEGLNAFFNNGSISIFGARTQSGKLITQGVIPSVTSTIAYLTTEPPVQTGTYIADIIHHTGFAPQVYAQGYGFSALTPVLEIWKAFRNIAYFLLIIVFVVIGFMIMFQSKIDHQTVVSVQLALPKLVFTAILITFSYAIAGFVVDLIYLSIFLVTTLLDTFGIVTDAHTTQNVIFGRNILALGLHFIVGIGGPGRIVSDGSAEVAQLFKQITIAGHALTSIAQGLAFLIIAVAIVIALFRTLFALITAYVGIIVATIFAPLQLLANAFPGSDTFGNWIKGLIANAAVFPAVVTMVLIGAALVGGEGVSEMGLTVNPAHGYQNDSGWIPPLLGSNNSQPGMNGVRGIIGLGIILLLPEVVNIIREALGVRDTLGQMAWQNAQRGTVVITRPLQSLQQTFNERQQQVREAEAHGLPAPRVRLRQQVGRWFGNMFGF